MTVSRWRSVLVRAGALVALTLLGWCAPSGARAGCGDYVVLDAHPALAAPAAHDTPAAVPQTRSTPMRLPVPCHGPTCSRGSLPPWNAVPPSPTHTEQWGQVGSFSLLAEQGRLARCCLPETGQPQHCPSSIYHPPRLSRSSVTL
jgi:hypothetical protein